MKKIAIIAILLLITGSAFAEQNWLDFLDEKSKEFLLNDEMAVAAFDGATIQNALMVNEGTSNEEYYLVSFEKNGKTTGILKIDAANGAFEEAKVLMPGETYLPVGKALAKEMTSSLINPETTQGVTIKFDYNISTNAEWKYGNYSISPWDPYWRTTAAGGEWIITKTGSIYENKAATTTKPVPMVVKTDTVPQSTASFLVAGKFYEITSDLNNETFEATITFNYEDADQDGKVDGTSIKETQLNVYYYGTGTAKWIIIPNPTIDAQANTISITVNHFTLFMLAAPKPEPEPETQPQNTGGGSTGGGGGSTGGSGGGGGGGTPTLSIKIEGSCVGQPVTISVLNTAGNPAKDAKVLARKGNATIAEQTTEADGKVSFTFKEKGDYTIYVTKNLYTQNSKTITISECTKGQEPEQPTGNQEENTLEEQAGQETQKLGQAEQAQGTETRTGFFSLENSGERTTIATLAGACAAIILGMALYIKGKKKKK